jgi:hypothetical protein
MLSLIRDAVQAIFHAALRPDREDQLIVMLDNALADFEAGVDVLEPGTMPRVVREIDRLRDERNAALDQYGEAVRVGRWLIAEARWLQERHSMVATHWFLEHSATSQTATPAPSPHAGVATPTGADASATSAGPGGTPEVCNCGIGTDAECPACLRFHCPQCFDCCYGY